MNEYIIAGGIFIKSYVDIKRRQNVDIRDTNKIELETFSIERLSNFSLKKYQH